jgi:hypothetical protein
MSKTLSKGGKPVAGKTAASLAYEKSSAKIAELMARLPQYREEDRKIPLCRVTAIDGSSGGQYYVRIVSGKEMRLSVPTFFLKDAGTKKVKINCPDLLKIGCAVLYTQIAGKDEHELIAVFTSEEEKIYMASGILV